MDIELRVKVVFRMPMTKAHIEVLSILASHHYDVRCKNAENNVFVTWTKDIEFHARYGDPTEQSIVEASFSDFDTCLKIMEGAALAARFKLITEAQRLLVLDMQRSFRGATALANEKYNEWQTTWPSGS